MWSVIVSGEIISRDLMKVRSHFEKLFPLWNKEKVLLVPFMRYTLRSWEVLLKRY